MNERINLAPADLFGEAVVDSMDAKEIRDWHLRLLGQCRRAVTEARELTRAMGGKGSRDAWCIAERVEELAGRVQRNQSLGLQVTRSRTRPYPPMAAKTVAECAEQMAALREETRRVRSRAAGLVVEADSRGERPSAVLQSVARSMQLGLQIRSQERSREYL